MRKLLVIAGPTAVGKTSLGIKLAKKLDGEIVSADSRQIYKYLDIGTGKDLPIGTGKDLPSDIATFQECDTHSWNVHDKQIGYYLVDGVKIWLYDVIEPDMLFSAGKYALLASKIVDDILDRGKLPIIVGGTGFYIKALLGEQVLSPVKADWKLRNKLEKLSAVELQQKLININNLRLSKMNDSDKQNPRRLIRAIEIAKTSSNYKLQITNYKIKYESLLKVGLTADKKELYKKVDQRVNARYKEGIVDEIKNVLNKRYNWEDPGLNNLGYLQWKPYFEGKSSINDTMERWKFDEYNYAKRQLTYFRKDKNIVWFDILKTGYNKLIHEYVQKWYYEDSKQ